MSKIIKKFYYVLYFINDPIIFIVTFLLIIKFLERAGEQLAEFYTSASEDPYKFEGVSE